MRSSTPGKTKPPRSTSSGKAGKAPAATKSRKDLIHNLLVRLEAVLESATPKATLADFIRLTQLERELEQDEQPAEIVVTWKEPAAESSIEK